LAIGGTNMLTKMIAVSAITTISFFGFAERAGAQVRPGVSRPLSHTTPIHPLNTTPNYTSLGFNSPAPSFYGVSRNYYSPAPSPYGISPSFYSPAPSPYGISPNFYSPSSYIVPAGFSTSPRSSYFHSGHASANHPPVNGVYHSSNSMGYNAPVTSAYGPSSSGSTGSNSQWFRPW
jgi:hypothetical protein